VAGHLGGEGDLAGILDGAILGHEDAAAAGNTLEYAEDAATTTHLGVGLHLDGAGHPGELTALGVHALVGVE